jgi:hypothetical protein
MQEGGERGLRVADPLARLFWLCPALQTFSLEPRKSAVFTVQFAPKEAGAVAHSLEMRVRSNPFEATRIALTGACRGQWGWQQQNAPCAGHCWPAGRQPGAGAAW